jgi:hypothetical protein
VVEQSDTITSFFQPFLFTEVFRKEVQERLKQLKTLCQKNMTHICMGGQTNETLMNNRESVTFIRYFNGSFNEAIKESLSYKKIKKLSFFNMNLPQKEKALKLTDE